MHYIAVIDKDVDSAFGIRFPEAPGCFSAADSFEDILPNAVEALALYFEDGEEARPRGLEAVRAEVAEDIAAGAFLMLVPHVGAPPNGARQSKPRQGSAGHAGRSGPAARHEPLGVHGESSGQGNTRPCRIVGVPARSTRWRCPASRAG